MVYRKATPEETQALFGDGLVLFGQKRPAPSAQNSTPPASGSAEEPDPMLPAAQALESWLEKKAAENKG